MQSKPPSDLVAVLGDHFALNADRYGLDADALRLERVYGSGVRRSFRVHDDDNSIHVKLWPATRRSVWEQWFAVREVLESRYQAPRIMGLVDLPDIAMGGLVFEHIEGMPPVSGSYTGLLLDLALRLHADRELAPRIGLLRGAETVGQCFERTCIRRWDIDIGIIRDASLPLVSDVLLEWMERETRRLEQMARDSVAFDVPVQLPTHGDLCEGNTLISSSGDWYVLDWDSLALGDPVVDYIRVLWDSARHDLASDWHSLAAQADDDGFADRMGFYARVTLLEEVIDGLADCVELDAANPVQGPIRREMYETFEESLPLYRERYG